MHFDPLMAAAADHPHFRGASNHPDQRYWANIRRQCYIMLQSYAIKVEDVIFIIENYM